MCAPRDETREVRAKEDIKQAHSSPHPGRSIEANDNKRSITYEKNRRHARRGHFLYWTAGDGLERTLACAPDQTFR